MFQQEFDGGRQILERFRLGAALAVGARHVRRLRPEPAFPAILDHGAELARHTGSVPA